MFARKVVAPAVLIIALCACNGNSRPLFERECGTVQEQWSGTAKLMNTSVPRLAGNVTEATWAYAFGGGKDAAIKAFEDRVPVGYREIRDTASGLEFVRFDGHDTYELTISFSSPEQGTTTVAVALRGFPD